MRAVFLLAFALAACSEAPPPEPDMYAQMEVRETAYWVSKGLPQEEAAAKAKLIVDTIRNPSPEVKYRAAKRQEEIRQVHTAACKNAPYLDGC